MPPVTPPTPAGPAAAAPATSTPNPGVTPLETTLGNTPDKILQLAHQIQVSGAIMAPTDGSTVTLGTALGNLTIVLPILANEQQQKLIEQLTALFQNQKPLTVVVQPGDPPTQAFLLLPPPTVSSGATPPPVSVQPNVFQQAIPLPPLTPGAVLPAVVLPLNTLTANPAPPVQQPVTAPQTTQVSAPTPLQSPTVLSAPSLATAPTNEQLAILTDLSVLDELASKAEELMQQVLPELQARFFADTPLPQNLSQLTAPQPQALPIQGTTTPAPQTQPGIPVTSTGQPSVVIPTPIPVSAPTQVTLSPVSIPLQPSPITIPATPFAPSLPGAPSLSALLQPGAEVSLRVDAVALPNAPPLIPNAPNQILATVTGSGPNGQLLVQSGNTALYVKQGADVPVGSTLLITVGAAKPQLLIPLPLPDTNKFGALQQALAALAQADPELARQVMESVIPQPNAALGGALMFMLSAFGQGNIRSWLGNNPVDILSKTGKIELIARLTQQLTQGGQIVNDPVVGTWRSYTVPLHTENQFQTLYLYVHKDANTPNDKNDNEKVGKSGPNSIRFLIDMRLSKLGALQLDGFIRPKQLDMIVRSEKTLPEGLNENLRLTYIKSLEAVGYAGTLNFQTGRDYWLQIRKASGTMKA